MDQDNAQDEDLRVAFRELVDEVAARTPPATLPTASSARPTMRLQRRLLLWSPVAVLAGVVVMLAVQDTRTEPPVDFHDPMASWVAPSDFLLPASAEAERRASKNRIPPQAVVPGATDPIQKDSGGER